MIRFRPFFHVKCEMAYFFPRKLRFCARENVVLTVSYAKQGTPLIYSAQKAKRTDSENIKHQTSNKALLWTLCFKI